MLEVSNQALGVVSAIAGQTRLSVSVTGVQVSLLHCKSTLSQLERRTIQLLIVPDACCTSLTSSYDC